MGNIPSIVKEELKEKLNKQVFFNYGTRCKVGKLIGINSESIMPYYIVDSSGEILYLPCNTSLTLLK